MTRQQINRMTSLAGVAAMSAALSIGPGGATMPQVRGATGHSFCNCDDCQNNRARRKAEKVARGERLISKAEAKRKRKAARRVHP